MVYLQVLTMLLAASVTRDYYQPRGATLPRSCAVLMEARKHPMSDLLLAGKFEGATFQAKESSGYRVKAENSWTAIASSGTFLVDPATDNVVRMMIVGDELPEAVQACGSTTSLDFAKLRIGEGEFLLPGETRQRFVATSGEEAENHTVFSTAPALRIPRGARFTFEPTAPILADTATAGDPFTSPVSSLCGAGGKQLAPVHAPVHGRLLRVQIPQSGSIGAVLVPFPWEHNSGVFELKPRQKGLEAHVESAWITTGNP